MKILINDIVQKSTTIVSAGSDKITTPSLIDVSTDAITTIEFDSCSINCLALGNYYYTGATIRVKLYTAITDYTIDLTSASALPDTRIYYLGATYVSIIKADITFVTGASFHYVGRIGLGLYRNLPIYKAREPGWINTSENRKTLGGQVVENLGGVTSRTIGIELRCKITSDIYADLEAAKDHLPLKFPYFIDFTDEYKWFGFYFFYAIDKQNVLLQSSMRTLIYSKKFEFEEVF